jgi:hypothetical protein
MNNKNLTANQITKINTLYLQTKKMRIKRVLYLALLNDRFIFIVFVLGYNI